MDSKSWFFLVWNLGNYGTPTHKHDTYEAAEKEAMRLAGEFPGKEFHVVKALACIKRVEPVTVQKLEDPDIPF